MHLLDFVVTRMEQIPCAVENQRRTADVIRGVNLIDIRKVVVPASKAAPSSAQRKFLRHLNRIRTQKWIITRKDFTYTLIEEPESPVDLPFGIGILDHHHNQIVELNY